MSVGACSDDARSTEISSLNSTFTHFARYILVSNSAFSNIMLFSGENRAGQESFLEKWTPTRDLFQANSFYLYTGQMGTSSHSLSSYKVSGHACPPLAES